MIVFGTNFTTDFNDNVTWKPWRMCSGRKWRVEVLAVPGGHLGGIQHCERSVCVSRPNGTWVPGGTQKDAQWQSRFPQEVGPFIGLLGSQLHVPLRRSFSAAALVPVLPPGKDQSHHGAMSDGPSGPARRLEGAKPLDVISEEPLAGHQWAITLLYEFS